MAHTYKKSASLHYASFLTLTEVKCFKYSASCSQMLFTEESGCKGCFAASKPFFLRFLLSSVPPAFSAIPSPLSLPVLSPFPHFWSIFYALLHYSQLPFTVHYLLPSFTNTLCTSLSFLQSLCFPPSLSSSALWHFPLLLPPSPPLLSLCLFSGHVISC